MDVFQISSRPITTFGLRHKTLFANDCWSQARFLKSFSVSSAKADDAAVKAKMITIPVSESPIPVASGFSGISIYKTSCALSGDYVGLDSDGFVVCAHVYSHKPQKKSRVKRLSYTRALLTVGGTNIVGR